MTDKQSRTEMRGAANQNAHRETETQLAERGPEIRDASPSMQDRRGVIGQTEWCGTIWSDAI